MLLQNIHHSVPGNYRKDTRTGMSLKEFRIQAAEVCLEIGYPNWDGLIEELKEAQTKFEIERIRNSISALMLNGGLKPRIPTETKERMLLADLY